MLARAPFVRVVVAAAALGVVFAAGMRPARAQERQERPVLFALLMSGDLDALEPCGGETALARAVASRVRRPVLAPPEAADIWFSVRIGRGVAEITAHDRSGAELGRRDVPLQAGDCARSLDTLAVVLAIMIGPEERMTTEPPPLAAAPGGEEVAPAREPPRSPPPRRHPAKAQPRARRWAVSPLIEGAVGSGVLPGVAWSVSAGVVVTAPVARLHGIARGSFWPSQRTASRPAAEVDRMGGALLGCFELIRSGDSSLSTCGGADAGRIGARSASLSRGSSASLLVGILAEARFGYRVRAGGNVVVEPVIAAQINALLRRDRFTYRDASGQEVTLLQPAPIAVQTGFGVAFHFL